MRIASLLAPVVALAVVLSLFSRGMAAAERGDLPRRVADAFDRTMDRYGIPGGVLVLVQDGAVTLAHGHGYADLERKTAADPERTLFYLASVTKCFTATAVMQLVEQGRLDLERDVNAYLPQFKVPATYPAPVTLRCLLTHTAGFDDRNIGYVARTARETLPLGEYLRRALPPRVMPPGLFTAYSNHGYGLAGYLVELASGEEFSSYVESHILNALGMNSSTAQTPPPPLLSERAATMYFYNARTCAYEPVAPGYRNLPPAGTVWATGADMSKFLLAHLQGGATASGRILKEETTRFMHARQFSQHPELAGFAFGYYERFHSGMRLIEHAGGYVGAATLIALLPERNLGMFAATNQNTTAPHYAALQELLNSFAPEIQNRESGGLFPSGDLQERFRGFEGSYQNTRYGRRSLEKIAILDSQVRLAAASDGSLILRTRSGQETRWAERGPLLFRRVGSDDLLSFREDARGRITHMFMSLPGSALPSAFERLAWYDTLPVTLGFIFTGSALLASSFTLWPLVAMALCALRRLRGKPQSAGPGSRAPALAAGVTGLLVVAFFAGLDQMLGNSQYRLQMAYGMPPEMEALLWIPPLVAVLACVLAWLSFRLWRRRQWSLPMRIYYSLLALAALLFIPFCWNWNLL